MAKVHSIQEAVTAIRGGRLEEAAGILGEILAGQPGNEKARWLMIQCLERLQAVDQVQAHLRELLKHTSRNLAKVTQIALFTRQRGYSLDDVIEAFGKFLERTPGSAVAAYNHAYYLDKDGQYEKALEQYQKALDLGITAPEEVHLNVANLQMDALQNNDEAKRHLEAAIAINPEYAQAHFNLGNLAERLGDREGARRCFEKCLEIDPQNDYALARLADAHKFIEADDPLLARLAERAPESKSVDLEFSTGRAWEQVGEYDKAWPRFTRANDLDRATRPEYKQSRSESLVRRIAGRCDAEWLSQFGGESHSPVFICGIFRSGSTLLEQILGAHPAFTAGGESEFFPRLIARNFRFFPEGLDRLNPAAIEAWRAEHAALCERRTGGQSRLTDKRPDNFLHVGLIRAILPGAKFVVTERDWRDVAVSVYSTRLGPGQGYSSRLQDIRHYLGLHRDLIDHWERLLGDDLIRVSYEALVSDPRATVEKVLGQLGEAWDDACLDFHAQDMSVSTASVWQVREPINPRSVGRWANYRRYFAEAFGEDLEAA